MEENNLYQIRYLVIPDFVFQNPKLTYMAAKVYAFIHNYKGREFFFHNDKLARMFNCSEDSITRAISQLKEEGFIETHFDGRKRYVIDSFSLRNFSESASANLPTLPEAGASAKLRSLTEANLRLPNNNNINNNSYSKPSKEVVQNNPSLNEKFLREQEARRLRRQRRKSPGPNSGNFPTFDKPAYKPVERRNYDYSDIE